MLDLPRTILAAALLASSCYAEEPVSPVAVTAANGDELVEISPGVEVVADYGAPIFFADDYYWSFRDGVWFWSPWYAGGWSRAPYVPAHVGRIPHPEHYTHYRPSGWVRGGRGMGAGHGRPAPRGGHR